MSIEVNTKRINIKKFKQLWCFDTFRIKGDPAIYIKVFESERKSDNNSFNAISISGKIKLFDEETEVFYLPSKLSIDNAGIYEDNYIVY